MTEVDKGILAGEKTTPIESVCLYVPGGKGSFPSVLLMLGVPAVVAGVEKIVVVTPPNKEGKVDDAILTAAKLLGITEDAARKREQRAKERLEARCREEGLM